MNLEKLIVVTPGIRSDILECLAVGMTEQEILKDFPALRPEHITATLAFAARRERHLAA